jgi:hypothetical protein
MRRRASRVLRVLLFLLAIGLLGCIPLNNYVAARWTSRWPPERVIVTWASAAIEISWLEEVSPNIPLDPAGLEIESGPASYGLLPKYSARPFFERFTVSGWASTTLHLPLWLLAAICLAWPVTSLLLARRRRKGRGFAVEPAADAAPPAIDTPPPRTSHRPELHSLACCGGSSIMKRRPGAGGS